MWFASFIDHHSQSTLLQVQDNFKKVLYWSYFVRRRHSFIVRSFVNISLEDYMYSSYSV